MRIQRARARKGLITISSYECGCRCPWYGRVSGRMRRRRIFYRLDPSREGATGETNSKKKKKRSQKVEGKKRTQKKKRKKKKNNENPLGFYFVGGKKKYDNPQKKKIKRNSNPFQKSKYNRLKLATAQKKKKNPVPKPKNFET